MLKEYSEILRKAQAQYSLTKKSLSMIGARKIKDFDQIIHQFHDEVFLNINCRECGNCCRKLGPRINEPDIDRLSKLVRLKRGDFIVKYLRIDEDGDYVFKTMPCKFSGADNLCEIYEDRPRACRDYPHTREKNMAGRIKQLAAHTVFCPAAFRVAEMIIKRFC